MSDVSPGMWTCSTLPSREDIIRELWARAVNLGSCSGLLTNLVPPAWDYPEALSPPGGSTTTSSALPVCTVPCGPDAKQIQHWGLKSNPAQRHPDAALQEQQTPVHSCPALHACL